jgi:hypothetical protein
MEARGPAAVPEGGCVRASSKDGPQIVRTGGHRIGEAEIDAFLGHLAATCNVAFSAELTGFSKTAFYNRRRADPVLDERWRRAMLEGYGRIEELTLRTAESFLEGRAPPPESPIREMTMRDAIAIVKMYRAAVSGGEGKRPGWRGRPRSLDEVKGSILRKLAAIERHRQPEGTADRGAPAAPAAAAGPNAPA